MTLSDITPLVLTYNEAPNIARCLGRLSWAPQVVVLDSGSTDQTVALSKGFDNVQWVVRPFDDHTTQWNFGLDQVSTEWVLSLDADYILPEDFAAELAALQPQDTTDALYAPFRYCIQGKPLRASLYPPRAILFRRIRCRYVPDGHTQLLRITGQTENLRTLIDHDDRKPLSRWFISQDNYAKLEAEKLAAADPRTLRPQDKLRAKMLYAPAIMLIYTLFVRGVIWDGLHGWYYALQRTLAETMLSLRLIEKKLKA